MCAKAAMPLGSRPSQRRARSLCPIAVCMAASLLASTRAQGPVEAPGPQPKSAVTAAAQRADSAYKKNRGPFDTRLLRETLLEDSHRGTQVPVCIRAPRLPSNAKEPLPLIIFSHGAGGSGDAFSELCEHWASHGYIVVNPTHGDSVKLRRDKGERFDPSDRDVARQVVNGVNLRERRADVELILDSLEMIEDAINKNAPAATGRTKRAPVRIDPDRIALAGHSAGAMTTQALAGVKFYAGRAGRRAWSRREPRIKAFILISGQGLSRPTFHEDSWREIRAPLLVIAGSEDRSPVRDEEPAGRKDPYTYAPAGNKYLVFIAGATHSSYAGKQVTRVLGEKPPDNIT